MGFMGDTLAGRPEGACHEDHRQEDQGLFHLTLYLRAVSRARKGPLSAKNLVNIGIQETQSRADHRVISDGSQ
jgi:hypothetical protein